MGCRRCPYRDAMSIAITDDHRALADTVADFLGKHQARAAARALLEADDEANAAFWADAAALGWLGPARPRGARRLGLRHARAGGRRRGARPGRRARRRSSPRVMASAVLVAAGTDDVQPSPAARPGRRHDARCGGARRRRRAARRRRCTARPASVIGGGLADVLLVPVGDDVAVVDARAGGVTVTSPTNLDPTRRSAQVALDGAAAEVLPGARQALVDLARTILSAEAVGVARECTEQAAAYAKEREQFGRPIAMFQAVKHHCANMLVATELATAAVWDAARAAATGGDQFSLHRRHRRHARRRRPPTCAPSSTSRCTAASASPGSTTPTSTCGGPR